MRPPRGFTLIEMMVVLALIGIMAVIGIGMMRGAAPRANLASDTDTIRQYLYSARARAVGTHKVQKVCVYAAAAPLTTPAGRLQWFEFDDLDGTSATTTNTNISPPANQLICNNETAYAGGIPTGTTINGVVGGAVAAGGTTCCSATMASPLPASCFDGLWCQVEDVNFAGGTHANDGVSIWQFKPLFLSSGNVYAQSALEITFDKSGLVLPDRSTYTQARIQLGNINLCNGTTPCAGFANIFNVAFTAGGTAKVVEGL